MENPVGKTALLLCMLINNLTDDTPQKYSKRSIYNFRESRPMPHYVTATAAPAR